MVNGHNGVNGYIVMHLVVEEKKYDIEIVQIQHLEIMVTLAADHLLKAKPATHLLAQVIIDINICKNNEITETGILTT